MELLTRLEAPVGGLVLVGSIQGASDSYYYYQPGRVEAPAPARAVRANGSNGGAPNPLPKRNVASGSPEDAPPI